jgi:hypothetical protein
VALGTGRAEELNDERGSARAKPQQGDVMKHNTRRANNRSNNRATVPEARRTTAKCVDNGEKAGRIFARLMARTIKERDLAQVSGGQAVNLPEDPGCSSTWSACTVWDGTSGIDDIDS